MKVVSLCNKNSGRGTGDIIQWNTASCPLPELYINQDPVVQSIVSLTRSLRGQLLKCFPTL